MLPWRQPARTLVAEANLFFICLLNCLIHLHHSLILNKFWSKDFLIQQHESQGEARKYIYHSTCWAMSTAHHYWLLVVLEILEFLEKLEIETWTVILIKSCIVRTVWHIHYSMHMGDIRKYYIAMLFCKTNTIQKKFQALPWAQWAKILSAFTQIENHYILRFSLPYWRLKNGRA